MRRAAKATFIGGTPRWLAALSVFGLAGACSVYGSALVEATAGSANGGSASSGSDHGGAAGKTGASGGKAGMGTPSEGGEAGDANGSEMGGAGDGGTSNVAGTAGVAGSETGGGGVGSGTAGSGGMPTNINLIDDFEDQNLTIKQSDTRGGVWYLFDNGTAGGTTGPDPLVCSPNGSDASPALGDYAMHITASGFTGSADVGSGLGVDFRNQRKVYDASQFSGISFWAKVGAGKNLEHRIQIADATTDEEGGKCSSAEGMLCDDHFGKAQAFTTTWAEYQVRFDQLTQAGWGNSAVALDKAALYGLQFTAKPGVPVDLWLDQIEFF